MSARKPAALSVAARAVWAKTDYLDGTPEHWAPLHTHLDDAGRVAGLLWDEWLAPRTRARLESAAGGQAAARDAVVLAAAIHDIGKATPAFAVQVPVLADRMRDAGLAMARELPDRRDMPHALAGQAIVLRWLLARGVDAGKARAFASITGFHHGIAASKRDVLQAPLKPHLLGDATWTAVQDEILTHAVSALDIAPAVDALSTMRFAQDDLMTIAGIVVIADWIASSQETFTLVPLNSAIEPLRGAARFSEARARISLPEPWAPHDAGRSAEELLRLRFNFPADAQVFPAQRAAVGAARTMGEPGLVIIEAPCGDGKSEAALLTAEILAARFGCSGVMVGLPTQATSNAMFGRVLAWLARTEGSLTDQPTGASVFLAHGAAAWQRTFRELHMNGGAPRDIARDEVAGVRPYVDSWMTGRRKGVIADIVVGTIDQILIAALAGRYVQLRHVGLARKVVILDEVHAYDAYMTDYLKAALTWLGAHGVPVIALSATLTSALRAELVGAYEHGRQLHRAAHEPARPSPVTAPVEMHASGDGVARLTWTQDGVATELRVPSAGRRYTVGIEHLDDSIGALVARVNIALGEPRQGCVLVLCNTVRRAQERYQALARELGDDVVTLAHSRFILADRRRNDERLVAELGRPEVSTRPAARVVVATQVAEQSLDIDADLLITDLAPMDLIIQRIGRLHRHSRPEEHRPAQLRRARCVVTGFTADANGAPVIDRGGEYVYGRFVLLQAAGLIVDAIAHERFLQIPDDVEALVERAYGAAPTGPQSWHDEVRDAWARYEHQRGQSVGRARVFQLPQPGGATGRTTDLTGLLDARVGDDYADADSPRAQVRDGIDSFEVLLLLEDEHGQLRVPGWIDHPANGEIVPTSTTPEASVAEAVASCAVRLPAAVAQGSRGDALITSLESRYIDAWRSRPELSGQLVLALDQEAQTAVVAGSVFSYDPTEGLRVVTA